MPNAIPNSAQDAPPDHAALDQASAASFRSLRRRLLGLAALLLLLLFAIFLPPYLNVSRFQRRITSNLSAALGRPVHLDRVTLSLFPLPGFTLDNFVVDEDPAFGFEPILRADQVRATVRIASLWSRRVEFSRIALTDPHVNLVRTPDGRWNLQSILLQAARSEAAPTTQRTAGPAPRFPYIEATGARLNLKLGQQKTPWSLTEADFALWLPQPRQWRFRLEARPQRTDTAPADSGLLKLEATLGGALAHTPADTPIDVHGTLQDAQLGGLSRLLLGRDAGLRGDLNLDLRILGTLAHASLASTLKLDHARRADFVPPHLVSLEAACQASADDTFHAFHAIECHWPPPGSANPSFVILSADIPNTRQPARSTATLTLPALPSSTLLDWLRAASPHPPTGLAGTGTLSGSLTWNPSLNPATDPTPAARTRWSGELELANETLQLPNLPPAPLGDILLRLNTGRTPAIDLPPVALPLGARQPALLEAHADAAGYTLYLTGPATLARLLALADAFPQFGDGLRPLLLPDAADRPLDTQSATTPTEFDLTATRLWSGNQSGLHSGLHSGPQLWTRAATAAPAQRRRRHR